MKKNLRSKRLFLLGLLLSITLSTWAQNVSLNYKNTTFENVLKAIKQQTGCALVFSDQQVDVNRTVTINVKNVSVNQALEQLLKGTDLTYEIRNNKIYLKEKPQTTTKTSTYQAGKRITGTIKDAKGEPIIGANVVEKGTTNGTITDIDGKFTLEVSNENAILNISYIGFVSQEIKAGNKSALSISLNEDSEALEEVVVVGYGVQKKVNVIGSIAQIDSKKLENRSAPQLSNALTGQMPGVTVIQRSGRPGSSSGEVRVRGVGSFGAEPTALVLIDGIPGDMDQVNPEDVESVSVLKDAASAAIYGSRAANGVILVTTKSGKEGKVTVSYSGYVGMTKPTELPEFVDTWDYAALVNEARGQEVYTQEEIQKFKDGSDPDHYANAHYLDETFSRNGFQTGHDLSVNGGDGKNLYMLSFGYLSQDGIVEKNNFTRYNARANVITQLSSTLKLTTRLSGIYSKRKEPAVPGGDDVTDMLGIIQKSIRMPGLTPSVLSDGTFALGNELHGVPSAWIKSDSFYNNPIFRVNANVKLDWTPIDGLVLSAIGAYDNNSEETKHYRSTFKLTGGRTMGPSSLKEESERYVYTTFQATADYNKSFGEHDLGLLLGYSWEQEDYHNLIGSRDKFPGNDLPYINAGSPDNQKSEGTANGWALQSYFGRLTYDYAERYLFEATFRYDGSSRFPENNKFGFFPSLAAGWRLSEESFMKENEALSWISNLKLKASYGQLGNQNIGNYPYQKVYELGQNYPFGDNYTQGAAIVTATDPTIKWEKTSTYDIGFESMLWNGLVTFNAAYFHRKTSDILYKPSGSVSLILGQTVSEMNTGELLNSGLEIEVGHQNKIGDFRYALSGNLSVIHNEVLSLGVGDVQQLNGMVGNGSDLFIGHPMQLYYGYKTDGVFLDQADIDSWYDQTAVNTKPQIGDIRYKDISGPDGVPDGKVDPNYDRVPLGSRIPKYTFGLNINLGYKDFDFSALFQGVAGAKGRLEYFAGYALANQGNIQKWQAEGRFDPENPTRYPDYPRIEDLGNATPPNYVLSDFWTLNANYLRLKTVQIGYTLPRTLLSKVKIENLRIYLQTENPLSFNSYRKGWDPEINTNGNYYPILATYTVGLNLKF